MGGSQMKGMETIEKRLLLNQTYQHIISILSPIIQSNFDIDTDTILDPTDSAVSTYINQSIQEQDLIG